MTACVTIRHTPKVRHMVSPRKVPTSLIPGFVAILRNGFLISGVVEVEEVVVG